MFSKAKENPKNINLIFKKYLTGGTVAAKKMEEVQIGQLLGEGVLARVDPAGVAKGAGAKRIGLQDAKRVDAGATIATNLPSYEDMAYTHAVLCQVGLPRARVEGREFLRQSGTAWINVQAGYLDEGRGPVLQPLPYGPITS
jgi:hypothetical protein